MPLKRELGSQTLCVDAVDARLSPESTTETTEIPPEHRARSAGVVSTAVHFASGPRAGQIPRRKKKNTNDWSTASERECKTG